MTTSVFKKRAIHMGKKGSFLNKFFRPLRYKNAKDLFEDDKEYTLKVKFECESLRRAQYTSGVWTFYVNNKIIYETKKIRIGSNYNDRTRFYCGGGLMKSTEKFDKFYQRISLIPFVAWFRDVHVDVFAPILNDLTEFNRKNKSNYVIHSHQAHAKCKYRFKNPEAVCYSDVVRKIESM